MSVKTKQTSKQNRTRLIENILTVARWEEVGKMSEKGAGIRKYK